MRFSTRIFPNLQRTQTKTTLSKSRIKFQRYIYLNSVLWQLDFNGEGLSGINVRIMTVFKSFLQFFQLVICEDCPMPSFLRSVFGGGIFQHTF